MKTFKATISEVLHLTRTAGTVGSTTLQRKLAVYWASLLLTLFAAFILLASLLGLFSTDEGNLSHTLETHHESTVSSITKHTGVLAAQSISISNEASDILDNMLLLSPTSELNDDEAALKKAERALFPLLKGALESSPCNGAFLILDATVNTAAPNAATSRAGLLVRYANLSKSDAVNQDIVFYRGIYDIARENGIELHNRWRMEFDTSLVPWYNKVVSQEPGRLADSYFWTERMQLTDTWEESILIAVPIYGADGKTRGVCGLELSNLFFQLSYPAQNTEYGDMITVVAPIEDGSLCLERGMTGGLDKTYLSNQDKLYVREGASFNTYSGESGEYLGFHTSLNLKTADGAELYAVTLVPRDYFDAAAWQHQLMTIVGSLILLIGALLLSNFLSKRFVVPITDALAALRAGSSSHGKTTGISEIDAIVSILDEKAASLKGNHLPPEIASLLDEFAGRFASLTATERRIIRLYSEDMDVSGVAEAMFISIHTVRKHNANIYRKLNVNSREELVLYLELFRRCGRLDDLLNPLS